MRPWQKTLIAAASFCILAGPVAFADSPGDRGPSPGQGWAHGWDKGGGGGGGSSAGAPGPIAGAGLPFLLIAGGYVMFRRYRRNRRSRME